MQDQPPGRSSDLEDAEDAEEIKLKLPILTVLCVWIESAFLVLDNGGLCDAGDARQEKLKLDFPPRSSASSSEAQPRGR